MGQILACQKAKPGFGAYLIDFHITKNTTYPTQDKIHLFVAQTENIETSSCLISPPQVNFLLNGNALEKRTMIGMDSGPQIPSIITSMLKYGTNLLQAIGEFSGHYVIVIAYMSVVQSFGTPVLEDYVQPVIAPPDADMEVIEEASRISLNCPISFTRIRTPVKGRSCKHFQCVDFENYLEINARRPSWRCPHCNQGVCYTDIRVDQNMFKVLREAGEDVSDVIISNVGSWKAVSEGKSPKDQQNGESLDCQKEASDYQEVARFSNASCVLDLTEEDNEMDSASTFEIQETKPLLVSTQTAGSNLTPVLVNLREINQNACSQFVDDRLPGDFVSSYGSVMTSDGPMVGGISGSATANTMCSPVLTDAVSPVLNRGPENFCVTNHPTNLSMQNPLHPPASLPLQQLQSGQLLVNNEYRRVPWHPNRIPEVQSLPVMSSSLGPQQRSRPPVASQASPSIQSTLDSINVSDTDMQRQQQFSRSLLNQKWNHRNGSFPSTSQSVLQGTSIPVSSHSFLQSLQLQQALAQQIQAAVGLPAQNQFSGSKNIHLQQAMKRMHHTINPSQNIVQPSTDLPRPPTQQENVQGGGIGLPAGTGSNQHAQYMVHAQQASQWGPPAQAAQPPKPLPSHSPIERQTPAMPTQTQTSRMGLPASENSNDFRASMGEQRGYTGGMGQPVPRFDGSVNVPSEQDWRPTGRMRGSLSGVAYSTAWNQFITQPSQPVQAVQSSISQLSQSSSLPVDIPAELQAFLQNSTRASLPKTHFPHPSF